MANFDPTRILTDERFDMTQTPTYEVKQTRNGDWMVVDARRVKAVFFGTEQECYDWRRFKMTDKTTREYLKKVRSL